MARDTTRLTRRSALVAGVAALSGCSALNLGGGFQFPDGTPTEDQKEITRTFVQRVHDGNYEAATEPFTSEMSDSMPPDRIERVWSNTVGDLGAYEEISQWGRVTRETVDAVFARVQCAKGYYALQVTLRGEKIAGLFIKNVVTQ